MTTISGRNRELLSFQAIIHPRQAHQVSFPNDSASAIQIIQSTLTQSGIRLFEQYQDGDTLKSVHDDVMTVRKYQTALEDHRIWAVFAQARLMTIVRVIEKAYL